MGAWQGVCWLPSRLSKLSSAPVLRTDDLQDPIWLGMGHMGSEGKVLFLHSGFR